MSSQEIREHAELFGWSCHTDDRRHEDTFINGENMVAVNYRRDGVIDRAARYTFYKITNPQLQETAGSRNKKSAVVSWLVGLGS